MINIQLITQFKYLIHKVLVRDIKARCYHSYPKRFARTSNTSIGIFTTTQYNKQNQIIATTQHNNKNQ